MANPYDDIVGSWQQETNRAPVTAAPNPYDAVVGEITNERQTRTRAIFEKALAVNPDQAAETQKLTRTTGLPFSVIDRNFTEAKRREQARMLDLARLSQDSPILARQLLDPTFTRQTHDHLENLSTLEQTFNVVRAVPAGAARGVGSLLAGSGEIIDIGARNIGLTAVSRAVRDLTGADPGIALDVAGSLKFAGSGWKMLADAIGPDKEAQNFATDVAGGIGQLIQQIGVQIATGGTASLVSLFSQGADAMSDKTKGDKASQAMRDTAVLAGASITALTEKYGVDALLNRVPPAIKNSALRWIADKLVAGGIEASQEITEGVLQDVVRKLLTNPNATIGDGSLYEASVAGTSAAIVRAALGVRTRGAQEVQKGQQAERDADNLKAQFDLAAQALLRERNPDEFRTLVQTMADNTEGAPKEIYVDAEVLNQLAPEVLNQLPQSVRDALPDALAANDVVAIATGDVLTIAPGTPLEQVLIENARIGDPMAMSQKEAKDAGSKAQEFLAQEAQRVIQQASDQQAMQASSDRVKQGVLDQLNTVGRFRKEVNEGYATWTAAFYTTLAGRTGMTPEQMAAKYPLRVVGQSGQGETLKAGKVGEITVEGYHYSKADRTVVSTSMYGTGLQGSNREMFQNAKDKRLGKRAYFYADTGSGITPEAGVGGRGHKATLTNIYDANTDPLRLKGGSQQDFESKVLDAGFSGYLDRLSGTQPGQVILLGDQDVPVQSLGALGKTQGQRVPEVGTREARGRDVIVDALNADTTLPSGSPTLARWQELLAKNPEVLQALTDAGVFAGDQTATAFKSGLIKAYQDATPAESYAQSDKVRTGRTLFTSIIDAMGLSKEEVDSTAIEFMTGLPGNMAFLPPAVGGIPDVVSFLDERRKASGLPTLDIKKPEDRAQLARLVAAEALAHIRNAGDSLEWYDQTINATVAQMAVKYPELNTDPYARTAFLLATAIASQGMNPETNLSFSSEQYAAFRETGKFPETGKGESAPAMADNYKKANALLEEMGPELFGRFLVTPFTVKELATAGFKVGGESMGEQVLGSSVFGPKIGFGFFSNLNGNFEPVTMDMWFMRTIGRLAGTLPAYDPAKFAKQLQRLRDGLKVRGRADAGVFASQFDRDLVQRAKKDQDAAVELARKVKKAHEKDYKAHRADYDSGKRAKSEMVLAADTIIQSMDKPRDVPASGGERQLLRDVTRQVVELVTQHYGQRVPPAALQALIWYPEQELYDAMGVKLAVTSQDYSGAARKLLKAEGFDEQDLNTAVDTATQPGSGRVRPGDGAADAGAVRGDGQGTRGTGALQADERTQFLIDRNRRLQQGEVNGRLEQAGDRSGRPAGGNLAPLEGAPSVPGFQGPDPRIVAVAEQYARDNGIDLKRQAEYVKVDPERATRIAAAYEAMQHNPQDPAVKEAYDNLIKQTLAQYQALEKAGYKFWFIDFNQPSNAEYASSPWNAMRDMRANQQMGVFPTNDGFGSGDFSPEANPLLADTGLQWPVGGPDGPLQPVLANDLFRAVHDAFGHGMEGAGFRADGEENAWQAHSRLFTGSAVGAITSETRGQNSWLNYGPNGESNRTAKVEDTVFADQKTGLMPEWTWSEGRAGDMAAEQPLAQGPRGTFSPKNLELALNENADLSTFLHETGHFFLEVMADLASQPGAPADIATDMAALLKWFGVTDLATWNALPLDGKRPYHERFAESFEQYLLEGKAPSLELQPLFRKFRAWMLNVYKSLKAFIDSRVAVTSGGESLAQGERQPTVTSDTAEPANWNEQAVGAYIPDGMTNKALADEQLAGFQKVGEQIVAYHATTRQALEGIRREGLRDGSFVETDEKSAKFFAKQYHAGVKAKDVVVIRLLLNPWDVYGGHFKSVKGTWKVDATLNQGDQPAGPNIQLSDEVRQVFDRMLASEAQIAEANEVAGLLPNEEADAEANERLTARSLRDLKWTVNARAREIKKLQAQAKEQRKEVEAEVTLEVNAMPEFAAKAVLDQLRKDSKAQPSEADLAVVADSFGYPDADTMLQAIDAVGKKADVIEGMTDQRMLEQYGDLIDQRAIEAAANEAVHNEARARSLATELRSQAEMLNPRTDTGQVNAQGSRITVNALVEAAKQFAANVISRTPLKDLKAKAWQHTAAERRAGKRWTEATAKGETQEAVKAKQDQMLNNAAAKAAIDAQAEMRKYLTFFKRVIKDNNEKVVEKGRDPDVVNAARAVLAAYGVAPKAGKTALEYLALVEKNDPAMFAALQPSVQGALNLAQPLDALTMDELRGLHEEIQAMWYLAKRSRQMEVDGNLLDIEDAEADLQTRMQEIGVPDTMPGDTGAVTPREELARKLQYAGSILRRVEQWAQGMGSAFTKLVFQPVKEAADRYRAERVVYRKRYQALVDAVAPALTKGLIAAPELNYTFGEGHNGIGHAELLHAILHTGNGSNKRKLLLGRGWATENADGTLNTDRWDAFLTRMHNTGVLTKAHYDFAQGVWDLLEQTKPLAQKTHRDVFGRYFAEVTADSFDTPFGSYAGGYVPAQADPRIVQDADLRKLAEAENENMSFSFPGTNKGFTKGRVEYNRPLMLDLRTIGQHLDKVLLFSYMEPAVRDVNKLLSRKGVSYSLGRIDPTIYAGMLTPWLSRSARQVVETPIVGDGGISRVMSAARGRAGMALMFANLSNTLQQITGFSVAAIKVKPASMMRATATFIAAPKQTAKAVADASSFMANRMENEIAAINDAMDAILLDPSLYEKSQAWTNKHAYFLQTAMANTMEPIIWTAAYNDAITRGDSDRDAVRHADSVIRTTQGSTLPEDVSRLETGPAWARLFTQFIGYFNMLANTNGTALLQVSREMGLKKGAGKALGIITLGMLAPIWVAEAIAVAMRGGPDDEDKDGYLDDWLMAVFGMGTLKGSFAMVPFLGQAAQLTVNRFNNNPADDKFSLSPAVSLIESTVSAPFSVYKAIAEDGNRQKAVRDVASAVSVVTGLPAFAVARPLGYLAGVEQGKVQPTSGGDMARGLVTGTASPASK